MTEISIQGDQFYIDGRPTYAGRSWEGKRIEGLLLNSRMVQATFDDANPDTHALGLPDADAMTPSAMPTSSWLRFRLKSTVCS